MFATAIRAYRALKGLFAAHPLPELNERFANMERVFKSPPLSRELMSAIRLISPHCLLRATEEHRRVWEADQNGACWGEYEALLPFIAKLDRPNKILEIGPGMGRSLVFFSKQMGWPAALFHAYEGEGKTTKYTMLGPRFEDSYCGNITVLRKNLRFNGIDDVMIFDAQSIELARLPGPYDFIYSFFSVGFHWSLEHFLDDILLLLSDTGIAVFTAPYDFAPFARLGSVPHRIIDWTPAWPKDAKAKFIILSKHEAAFP